MMVYKKLYNGFNRENIVNKRKKKILVLGSSGFIGKNLCIKFKDKKISLFGTYFQNKPKKNKNIKYIKANLTNKKDVIKVIKGMDVVIQAAAVTGGIKDAKVNPIKYISDNAVMNSLIFESVFKNNVKHFIFLSCSVMYHTSKKALKEKDFNPSKEIYPSYFGGAWNKIYFEKMCEFYSKISRTKFTAVRHSNVFGPHDTFDFEKSHLCSATIKKVVDLKKNKKFITVWGDGSEKRDLIFVDDLINSIKLIILKQKKNFEIFNIGSKKLISVKRLVQKVIKISGKQIKLKFDKRKPTNKFSVGLNCSKANKILGWKPKYDLEKALKITINWYKTNFKNE